MDIYSGEILTKQPRRESVVLLGAEVTDWDNSNWDTNGNKTEVVVNVPNNNVATLIYDANGGEFANGSSQYIITAQTGNWTDDDVEGDIVNTLDPKTDAIFKVKKFEKSDFKSNDLGEFSGWNSKPNPDPETEKNYSVGETIVVIKTDKKSSVTLYAV